jgi:hypothetical protein
MDIPNTVTYHFENGAKQICSINDKVIYNVKGRLRSRNELYDIFATTAHDLGAIKFEI